MMGTYDTRGGAPISPDEPDYTPSDLVDKVLGLLEDADVPTVTNDKIIELIELKELEAFDVYDRLENEVSRLRAALTVISEGRGPFSRDQLTFATSTIESMKQVALDALKG